MKLMPGENIATVTCNNTLTLTNFRIRYINNRNGTSILLENIQSIGIRYRSWPLLLILGCLFILSACFCLFQEQMEAATLSIILGCVFIGAYFMTQKHYVSIASGSGVIYLMIRGKATEKIIQLVDLIEETICLRRKDLSFANHAPL